MIKEFYTQNIINYNISYVISDESLDVASVISDFFTEINFDIITHDSDTKSYIAIESKQKVIVFIVNNQINVGFDSVDGVSFLDEMLGLCLQRQLSISFSIFNANMVLNPNTSNFNLLFNLFEKMRRSDNVERLNDKFSEIVFPNNYELSLDIDNFKINSNNKEIETLKFNLRVLGKSKDGLILLDNILVFMKMAEKMILSVLKDE